MPIVKKVTEYTEQVAIITWASLSENKYPQLKLLNSSLNGVRLSIGQAVKCKKGGMKKGFPDLFLPFPSGPYVGLFIELKVKGGRISVEQKQWLENLSRCGYYTCVCWSAKEAIEVIEGYLRAAKPIELV